jgi:methylated-DNA-[protein]-cysteine S-methyltransferase
MMDTSTLRFRSAGLDSPIGRLTIIAYDDRPDVLAALSFHAEDPLARFLEKYGAAAAPGEPTALMRAMERYFEGEVAILDTLATDAAGTPFQKTVWEELRRIPAGSPISYGELARRIGRPTAFRAVARGNATNPVAIVVPCHRVIASDGTLHGYAGGLDRKSWLLEHEAKAMGRETPMLKGFVPLALPVPLSRSPLSVRPSSRPGPE